MRGGIAGCALFGALCVHAELADFAVAQQRPAASRSDQAETESGSVNQPRSFSLTPETTRPLQPEQSSSVSLPQLLSYADAHAPQLLLANALRARAQASSVRASLVLPSNPELTVALGPRIEDRPTGLDIEAGLTQELEVAGQRSARRRASARLHERTEADIAQVRWELQSDVRAAFRRALVERERVLQAQRVRAFQEDVLRIVERQISAGEIGPLSLRLAQAEVAQARQVLLATEQELLSSRIQLAQLSGWPVDSPPVPRGELAEWTQPPPAYALLELARARLPGLRALAARVREAEALVVVEDREAWPNPSVGVQYQRESNRAMEGIYNIVLGAITLPIPVFQQNQAGRAEARAELSIAQAQLRAAQRLLSGQVAQARSQLGAAAQRMQAYQGEIVPQFEENLRLLARSFELGEIDLLALSAARERFFKIEADALNAQLDYYAALSTLERVVGQTLPANLSSAQPEPSP